ncbi:hypothetical protein CR513_57218, partial [Mucuna pruriens]
MVVDFEASYNVIMGRPTLNKLGTMVSTYHLCMKYPVGREVGRVWADNRVAKHCYEDSLRIGFRLAQANRPNVNVLDLDLDPRCNEMRERPLLAEDLKEINFGLDLMHKTKIGTTLAQEDESCLISFIRLTTKEVRRGEENGCPRGNQETTHDRFHLANGKWRMCTNYTDLNKACPKNPYPLPSIDRLVDGASGSALLSFMDAYSGYNQIKMHPQDEAKTIFITDARAYYYKVMPFELKNARATYQHLMDQIFKGLIGGDVEVYVDDMVVKSTTAAYHYRALRKVFQVLRKHQLKLNPEKCSFGVQAGKFWGFMLTEGGIKANLEKCQAIINMRSP